MRYLLILALSCLCLATFAFGQENTQPPRSPETAKAPKAYVLAEFGKINNRSLEKQMANFFAELSKDPAAQGCIINYGKASEKAAIKKRILAAFRRRFHDAARITILDGDASGPSTVLWIIPAGAPDSPVPVKVAPVI